MIELKRLSEEAICMDALDVEKLYIRGKLRSEVKTKPARVADRLTGEVFDRRLVQVGLGHKRLQADVATGTLYNDRGECMSSERLYVVGSR